MDIEQLKSIHIPVLLPQVLQALSPKAGGLYLDGTLGLGGHASAILEKAPSSSICGLDRDEEALTLAKIRLAQFDKRVHFFHLPFSEYQKALEELGWKGLDGALLDLGVSSLQLDAAKRGFGIRVDGPLDMRMDQSGFHNAKEFVNRASHTELANCIREYGEDPQAGRIAKFIINARQKKEIETTQELAAIINASYPPAWRRSAKNHPATRTFQAIRIHVNDELGELKKFLSSILHWLLPGARLVIISFHSLEDRIVKHAMRAWASVQNQENGKLEPLVKILNKKPVIADAMEIAENPRSASAKLRAVEKL